MLIAGYAKAHRQRRLAGSSLSQSATRPITSNMTSKPLFDVVLSLQYSDGMKNSSVRDQGMERKQGRPATNLKPRPKATTYRLDPAVQESLLKLQRFMNVPQNRLVNEAVKLFVEQKTSEVVSNVEDLVASVRLHRDADPHFEQSIARLVDTEAALGANDPSEGSIVVEVSPPASDQSAPTKNKRRGAVSG